MPAKMLLYLHKLVSVVLESTSIEYIDVVVVGSRGARVQKTETVVPVDDPH
ncbi:MAG: hypothetical protein IPP81_11250 [Chitinophagaceae bacterium]|nr:hypothetical protein [Chitinophagaceae bacterium]